MLLQGGLEEEKCPDLTFLSRVNMSKFLDLSVSVSSSEKLQTPTHALFYVSSRPHFLKHALERKEGRNRRTKKGVGEGEQKTKTENGMYSLRRMHVLLLLLSRFSRVRLCATP